jgi:signal transduction histidine kinase
MGSEDRDAARDPAAGDDAPGCGAPGPAAASASSLIEHIQGVMEHQKAMLARDLHDELGGLLVGAVMDLAWAEQHMSAPPAELKQKLVRARQTLAAAIDMKRKLIEELRPTLLDNVGLFAALRWHVEAACKRAASRASSIYRRTSAVSCPMSRLRCFASFRRRWPSSWHGNRSRPPNLP